MKTKTISGCFLAILVAVIIVAACAWFAYKMRETTVENPPTNEPPPTSTAPTSKESESTLNKFLPLGNPSNAVFNQSSPDNYLMQGEYFSLSYNRSKGIPNWVMWRLNKNSFGEAERQNDFRPDERLPNGWTIITPKDYTNSGYDRGHLCPSADRSNSEGANSTTFLMTNMAPQTHDLNAGPWEKLESYSRSVARRNMTLYIIAGQYGDKGKIKNKITIPTNFWKIIIAVPNGESINKNSRIVAVDMPNVTGISNTNWRDYKTTVQQLEQKTGYNFLSSLTADVQSVLKTQIDTKQ
ncbi:MAG TPA: DNA/RNA non-specific endonuclease [Pyrinomonadaceae bacterium]|nr:DNA/RNA non-specific endonuclease [Pyrinomonadaceae bacterium]